MKMRGEAPGIGHEVDDLVGTQVRLDAGDAKPLDALHPVQRADEVDEERLFLGPGSFDHFGAVAEVTDIDAGQDDLAGAHAGNGFGVGHYFVDGTAAAGTPSQWDGAKAALVIAAVLHLEKGARAVAEAEGVYELVGGRDLAGAHEPLTGRLAQLVDEVQDAKLFRGPQHQIHAGNFGDLRGFELRVAADHHDLRRGIGAQGAAHDLAALAIGELRHRAGIDHVHVGPFREGDLRIPVLGELAADSRGLRVVELAAQGVECDALGSGHGVKIMSEIDTIGNIALRNRLQLRILAFTLDRHQPNDLATFLQKTKLY